MKYNMLGQTNIKVSELCFGTLPMGPLQANLPVEKGRELLLHAMDSGITFFDTAELYNNYPYFTHVL